MVGQETSEEVLGQNVEAAFFGVGGEGKKRRRARVRNWVFVPGERTLVFAAGALAEASCEANLIVSDTRPLDGMSNTPNDAI